MATSELSIVIRAKDEASRALGNVNRSVGGLRGSLQKFGPIAGAALAGVGIAAIKAGIDFNSAFNTIRVGTGATGDALDALKGDFKAVFKAVPTDMKSAASAIADFNTLTGATGKTLQKLAINGLEAAKALGEESASLIAQAGKTIRRMNLEGQDAVDFMDKLFVASQNTGVPMTQLASILNAYGPVLTNLGFGLTKQIALFGSLQKSGLEVSRVMPGINAFMRRLASEGVTDLSGAFENVIAQITDATTTTDALNIATKAFGAEGAQRLVVAARSGALNIAVLQKAMDNSAGAIKQTAKETLTLGDRFKLLRNQALVQLEPILTKVFEILENGLTFLSEHQFILQATAVVVGVALVTAFTAWAVSAAAAAVATIIAMAPVLAIAVAIGALIAGIVLLVRNWGTVVDFMRDHVLPILTKVGDFFIDLKDRIIALKEGVIEQMELMWARVQNILGLLESAFRDVFRNIANSVIGAIETAMRTVIRTLARGAREAGELLNFLPGNPGQRIIDLADVVLNNPISLPRVPGAGPIPNPNVFPTIGGQGPGVIPITQNTFFIDNVTLEGDPIEALESLGIPTP